jgi:hypothetical protein
MSDRSMRAKMKVTGVKAYPLEGDKTQETLTFSAVGKNSAYPEDGSDEDNTFARYTPSASLEIAIMNPALFDQFAVGDTFYVDFTRVEKE